MEYFTVVIMSSFKPQPQITLNTLLQACNERGWKHVVVLYYRYAFVENPKRLKQEQVRLCNRLEINGRIIIANEGINGILEGTPESIHTYCTKLSKQKRFRGIHFKYSQGEGDAFPGLSIKVRPEIVALKLGDEDINPAQFTAPRIAASELHELFQRDEDFTIIDMRNDYEHAVGYFAKSRLPSMHRFRELPEKLHELEDLKNEKVITVCTGGVRCEKASALLLKSGFTDVQQLDGGMVTYMEQYPLQNYHGAMYTFDKRKVIDYDGGAHEMISQCLYCRDATERYIDCQKAMCNKHCLVCDVCCEKHGQYCSQLCANTSTKEYNRSMSKTLAD